MKHRRMFWNIVDKIEALIDDGKYPPGSRLPPERELAESFGVSRPTIREAIIALEVRQRVEVKTSSGVYVLEPKEPKAAPVNVSAFELTQARALVEGEAAALAAVSISDEELALLEASLEEMENGDSPEVADHNFHIVISKATRNAAIVMAVENFWRLRDTEPQIINAYKSVCRQSDKDRLEEHRAIYLALKVRDPKVAKAAMHGHFNRLINALFAASEAQALEEIRQRTSQSRNLYSITHLVG